MNSDPHGMMQNWSRWAESGDDTHHLSAKISSLWRFFLPHLHRDEGWGDPVAPDAVPDPVDIQAAEECDRALKIIALQHYHILRRCYYKHQKVDSSALATALRALSDVLHNKALDTITRISDKHGQDSLALNSEKPQ